ncbi:hypothetical protein JNJ66_05750 [Candidatus Saccharibacteria bacterium]|nr:hypothetical protein [Candidatus Saccharibacteria bacterium]
MSVPSIVTDGLPINTNMHPSDRETLDALSSVRQARRTRWLGLRHLTMGQSIIRLLSWSMIGLGMVLGVGFGLFLPGAASLLLAVPLVPLGILLHLVIHWDTFLACVQEGFTKPGMPGLCASCAIQHKAQVILGLTRSSGENQ